MKPLSVRFYRLTRFPRCTDILAHTTAMLEEKFAAQGRAVPQNQKVAKGDFDWLRRDRDCFFINQALPLIERTETVAFHSIRGVFQKGEAVFTGAAIKRKSHIQIAVRDSHAIIGYFRPERF